MKRIVAVLIVVSWCITAGAAPQQNPDAEGARRDFPVPADVTVVRDLVYADYGTRRLKLDVYLPPRADPRVAAPGVLVVRGGGWRVGALGADANARSISSASPVTFVSRRSAPLLLLHSPTDPVVPFALSVEIEARYRSAGATVMLTKIDAPMTHGFWLQTKYFPNTITRASQFLRTNLQRGH